MCARSLYRSLLSRLVPKMGLHSSQKIFTPQCHKPFSLNIYNKHITVCRQRNTVVKNLLLYYTMSTFYNRGFFDPPFTKIFYHCEFNDDIFQLHLLTYYKNLIHPLHSH